MTVQKRTVAVVGVASLLVAGLVTGIVLSQPSPKPPKPKVHLTAPAPFDVPSMYASPCLADNSDIVAPPGSPPCYKCFADNTWVDDNSLTPSLQQELHGLAAGTQVVFTTNDCYSTATRGFNSQSNSNNATPLSFEGNPSNPSDQAQDAGLYDSETQTNDDDGEIDPVIEEAAGSGEVISDLQIVGSDQQGSACSGFVLGAAACYISSRVDNSGILAVDTADLTIQNVSVRNVWGSGLSLQKLYPGPGSTNPNGISTNVTVVNFSVNQAGLDDVVPESVNGLTMCGLQLGRSTQGNAFDGEADSNNAGSPQNVVITGHGCTAPTGVTGSGCTMSGDLNFVLNPGQAGPVLVSDCQMTNVTSNTSNGWAIKIQAHGCGPEHNLCPNTWIPQGDFILSDDSFDCTAGSAYNSCFEVDAPFTLAVRGSTATVGAPGFQHKLWHAADMVIQGNDFGGTLSFSQDTFCGYFTAGDGIDFGGTVGNASMLEPPVNVTILRGSYAC